MTRRLPNTLVLLVSLIASLSMVPCHSFAQSSERAKEATARAMFRYHTASRSEASTPHPEIETFLASYYELSEIVADAPAERLAVPDVRILLEKTLNHFDDVVELTERTGTTAAALESLAFSIQEPQTSRDDRARLVLLSTFHDLIEKHTVRVLKTKNLIPFDSEPAKPKKKGIRIDMKEVGKAIINYTFWGLALKSASYVLMAEYEHHRFLTEQVLHSIAAFSAGGGIYSVLTQTYWQSLDIIKDSIKSHKERRNLRMCSEIFG